MPIRHEPFGRLPSGQEFSAFCLEAGEFSVLLSDYGATLLSLFLPDGHGRKVDILLGVDTGAQLLVNPACFGSTIGRVAGRISGSAFTLNGREYRLAANEGKNHLHGGIAGFDKRLWSVLTDEDREGPWAEFSLSSPDGDEGYPGRLEVSVRYRLSAEGILDTAYEARAEADTILSLTNHAYFNLAGEGRDTILEHRLRLGCSRYLVPKPDLVPTGEIADVTGGPFDFRVGKPVGRDISSVKGWPAGPGYDHCFIIDRVKPGLVQFAELEEPRTGRAISLSTTFPAVQFYTGNFLDGVAGRRGIVYAKHAGLCLETQLYPDAMNHPAFPSIVLRPGETWSHRNVLSLKP